MTRPILNLKDLELRDHAHGDRYGAKIGAIGQKIGAKKLGYNLCIILPGKAAFPAHNHLANEEMFYVVQGSGELRVGSERWPIAAGDVIACPPGGQETAHQIKNTGTADLHVLSVSTKLSPEIVEYPDSKKYGAAAEIPSSDGAGSKMFRVLGRPDSGVDYWDGE